MRRTASALIGAAMVLAGASAASASTTITFSEYAFTGQGPYGLKTYSSLTSQGFEFTNSVNVLGIMATNHYANTDPGGAVLTSQGSGVTRVRRSDGKAFSLESFDFADFGNDGSNTSFQFTYFDGVKETTRSLTYDTKKGLQTANLSLGNVQWFTVNTQAQFDNFRVGEAAAAVPEPTAWALMIMGFGGAGAQLRSRRRKVLAG